MTSTIYALKVKGMEQEVFRSLQQGEGRFGWSYIENADLHYLRDKWRKGGWDSLTTEGQACYQCFLLDIKPNDNVVFVNVPQWGQCTLARVTGPYFWKKDDADFNYRFHVDPESVRVFDRNDAIVPRRLSAKLKLQGRWWRLYDRDLFRQLLSERGRDLFCASSPALNISTHYRMSQKPREATAVFREKSPYADNRLYG